MFERGLKDSQKDFGFCDWLAIEMQVKCGGYAAVTRAI